MKNISIDDALNVLGRDAKQWWEYRNASAFKRLIDPESGQWASQFTANGVKYYIRRPEEGIGMKRYRELRRMLSVVGFNATYSDQMASLARMVDAANSLVTAKPRLSDLFQEITNMQAAIKSEERNWDFSFYAATLFIVTANEDLNEWSQAVAEEKIKNWHAEGLHEYDFFLLVMSWGLQLSEWWQQLPPKATVLAKSVSQEVK